MALISSSGVSVVIAAYNAERHIARALASVLAQTHAPREVIVVDDGSQDGTADVVHSYGGAVRLVRQSNGGPGAARNRGVRETAGELLAFLDADDELMPDMIGTLESVLRDHPTAAAASGGHYSEADGVRLRTPAPGAVAGGTGVAVLTDFFEVARRHHIVSVGSVVVRKREFDGVGGFREDVRFGEDLDLWGRLAGRYGWVFVDAPLMIYHRNQLCSATLRTPESEKPVDFLMDERRVQRWIREELRQSYRRYRRDMLLRQARRALLEGATPQARRLMTAIAPAPMSAGWVATAILARSRPFAGAAFGTLARVRRMFGRPYVY